MNDILTTVYLLSVPLENDYKHTLHFENKTDQYKYFASKMVKTFSNLTYQRKDNLVYVPEHIDRIYNCNYVCYQNPKIDDKWFYAFIKDMKYENDECTVIEIETDVMQTWMFDYTIKPSFVEREHVSDDEIGLHTVPEQLETGEFICNEKTEDETMKELAIYVAFSDYANSKIEVVGNLYNNIYSGMGYHIFPHTAASVLQINEFLNGYDDDAKADAINSLFMAPAFLGVKDDEDPANFEHHQVEPSNAPKFYMIEKNKQTSIDGYTPKNNKLLTYPYNYLLVSNNNGASAIYEYEQFKTDVCRFYVNGCLTPGGSIRLVPYSYKNFSIVNDEEGLNAGKFPICCWNSDTYINWLTSNGANIGLSLLSGAGQVLVGGAIALGTGGLGGVVGGSQIMGGVSTITNTLAQVHQQSMVPDQARGNTNCGDVITGDGANTFMFYKMSIKKEFAKIIDKYFDMFGYKVNMVKIPNTNHRNRWWFTKTIDVNIDGSIPGNDMQKIKDCYNRGITFWKNASEIQNYDLTNEVAE